MTTMSPTNSTGLLAGIDQGTTGTTVLLVDPSGRAVARGYRELPQRYPAPGWVEHEPEEIWRSVVAALAEARRAAVAAGSSGDITGVGLTNQRETTILWDRFTGDPVGPAIVWQDRRTADACAALTAAGHEAAVRVTTGLRLDPYFSATKIAWLLDRDPSLRARAERGELAFGTVDAWLVHRLTAGRRHVTDPSNASRTLLYDLQARRWSDAMCALFRVPRALLPELVPTAGIAAEVRGVPGLSDGTPIAALCGDQQAALYGQACLHPGDAKCTYGTGAFLLMNVGATPVASQSGLVCSVAWDLGGRFDYVLEGSAFVAGALVQWLRDGLGLIERASEIEALARSVPDSGGVTIVPALAGLGAPHWRPHARGLIAGVSRGTTAAHIARAALEAMALQICDLVGAMESDSGRRLTALRVDGGAAANDLLLQMQADLLGVPVLRPASLELTAMGAARLAGRALGREPLAGSADLRRFVPAPDAPDATRLRDLRTRWRAAVDKA
jgi:glycerol kinase